MPLVKGKVSTPTECIAFEQVFESVGMSDVCYELVAEYGC